MNCFCLWGALCLQFKASSASLPTRLDSLLTVWHADTLSIDERFLAFDALYAEFHQRYPDTLLLELEELAVRALEHNRPLILFESWIRRGGLLNYQGKHDEALAAYERAEEVIRPLGDEKRMGSIAANRGNVYANQSDYAKAMELFTTALEHYARAGYVQGQRNARMALGNVFVLIETFELGKAQYDEVLKELEWSPENARFRGLLLMNLGYCEYKLGHYDRASELYGQALALTEQAHSNFHLASCHQNMALLRLDEGNSDAAMFHAKASIELFQKLGNRESEGESQLLLARIQLPQDPSGALKLAEAIASELPHHANHTTLRDLHEVRYLAHKALGNVEQALNMHEQFLAYHDSVEDARNRYLVIRTAYEKEVEYRMRILELNAKEERDLLHIQQLKTVIWMIIGFTAMVGLFIAMSLRNKARNEQRRRELLKKIEDLKATQMRTTPMSLPSLSGSREYIESTLGRTLNETDWNVLNILLDDPTITNQGIAERAFMSIDGIGSSLRRMYGYFEVQETKYKKIALVHAVAELALKAREPLRSEE